MCRSRGIERGDAVVVTYLRKLTLVQRIIRLLYLKYVYTDEAEAALGSLGSILKPPSKIELAMLEKEQYEQGYGLH